MNKLSYPLYRLPDLSYARRLFVVCDEEGRLGVGELHTHQPDGLWVRPLDVPTIMPSIIDGLPKGAKIITATFWRWYDKEGGYFGLWYDDEDGKYHRLQIINDLGWVVDDKNMENISKSVK